MTVAIIGAGCSADKREGSPARPTSSSVGGDQIAVPAPVTSGGAPDGSASTSASAAPPAAVLSTSTPLLVNGLGPLTFGMTPQQAEGAVGSPITVSPGPEDCDGAAFAAQPPGVTFFFVSGHFAVVELYGDAALQTLSGISLGSAEADVHQAYGSHLSTTSAPQNPTDTALIYRADDPALAAYEIVFTIRDGRVADIQAGERSLVERSELCG